MLTEDDKVAIAEALYLAGFEPSYSTGAADNLIAGYGKLNWDFEYPLYLDAKDKVIIIVQKV